MYSQALRAEIDAACKDFATLTVPCLKALSEMETQIGNFDGTRWHLFFSLPCARVQNLVCQQLALDLFSAKQLYLTAQMHCHQ
jgi:hypothetical protein